MEVNRTIRGLLGDYKDTCILVGESGGLVAEPRTPEREVGVRYLPPPCCYIEQRHTYSPKGLAIHRKRWLRPDMTEKMFTGTFSLNNTKECILNFSDV